MRHFEFWPGMQTTKLKLRFHRQNVLSCCLIRSMGIDFEFLEGTNCQGKCAVTKR